MKGVSDMSAEAATFPEVEDRKQDRLPIHGSFVYTYDGHSGDAEWNSYSHEGASISMKRYLRPGRLIHVSQDGHDIFGTVVWCRPTLGSTSFLAGIRFTDGSVEASFLILSAMVQNMIRSRKTKTINVKQKQ
jgi:hypothetical protein